MAVRDTKKFRKPKRGGGKRFTDARTLSAQNQASDDITDSESKSDSSNDDHEESSKGSTADDSVDANLDAKPPVTQNSDVVGAYASLSLNASAVRPSELLQQPTSQRGMVVNESSLGPGRSPSSKQSRHRTVVSHDSDEKVISDRAAVKAGPSDKQSEDDLSMGLLPKRSVGSGTTNRKEREAKARADAHERYLTATRAGKTDQAKSDLARLAEIRHQRALAAERREAERNQAELAQRTALTGSSRKQ